jgi:hypothetical protein
MTGAAGAVVSTVKVSVAADEVFPAASLAVADNVCEPCENVVAVGHVQAPPELAVTVQIVVAPSVTVTVEFASAVPDGVCAATLMDELFAGTLMTGAAGAVVSMVKVSVAADEMLPAASLAVADNVCEPCENVVAVGHVQVPPELAVTVQMVVAPSVTVTVEFASAVPEGVCAATFVFVPFAGTLMTGAAGAVVSMVKVSEAADEVLPAASLAVADSVCEPCENVVAVGHVQVPPELAVTVQIVVAPSFTVTVELASAVPDGVCAATLVLVPFAGTLMTGAAGAVVSMVKVSVAADEVLPAASFAVAESVCEPCENVVADGHVQVPPAVAVTVQMVVAPSVTVTVELASAVPEGVCAATFVFVPFAGTLMTGAAGAVVSTVKVSVAADEVLPAASLAVAESVCEPCENVVAVGHVQAPPELAVTVQIVVAPSFTVTVEFASAVPEGV